MEDDIYHQHISCLLAPTGALYVMMPYYRSSSQFSKIHSVHFFNFYYSLYDSFPKSLQQSSELRAHLVVALSSTPLSQLLPLGQSFELTQHTASKLASLFLSIKQRGDAYSSFSKSAAWFLQRLPGDDDDPF